MRITSHSTLTISTCALALLSQLPSAHSAHGFFKEGDNTITTFAQRYVMEHLKELGLSKIRWSGGNDQNLRLARVTWNKHDAFMKCDIVSSKPEGFEVDIFEEAIAEVYAFNALVKAKKELEGDYATGRQNVMDPLHQFNFSESNGNRYFCHLYSFINGVLLDDYFRKHTIAQAYITAAKILPDIIRGLIYLYNAGIIHYDLHQRNIMIQKNFVGKIVGVKLIDMDGTEIFRRQQGWAPISSNDEEHLTPNPRLKYKSCDGLKGVMAGFLVKFIFHIRGDNPYVPNYVLAKQAVLDCLEKFKRHQGYIESRLGNVKAVIPAIRYLLKVYYTIRFDPFACSSPMRALKELPPRTL